MTLAVLSLFVIALLCLPLTRRLGVRSTLVLPLPLIGALLVIGHGANRIVGGEVVRESMPWVPSLGIDLAFRLDGLSLLMTGLVTIVGAAVMAFAAGYFSKSPVVLARFASIAMAFAASMLGVVLADDLFVLFVFWELTSLCSFLLVGLHHEQENARSGAMRALLVTGAGGLSLLLGILFLVSITGTSSITETLAMGELVRASPLYLPTLLFILGGALTKSAQVPFHYWLPGAMAAPAPISAFLHSATLVKAGVYLLIRLHPVLGFRDEWHVILGHIGALTMLVGAAMAFVQHDLKKLLAYTTIAGLGTIVLLIGFGTEAAIHAALVFLGVHALYKAALFMLCGYLEKVTGTRDLRELGGLARKLPFAALAMTLGAGSMAGLPPLLGSLAKELLYEAKLGAPEAPTTLVVLSTLANALVVACALLITIRPFFSSRTSAPLLDKPIARKTLVTGALVLTLLGLALGLENAQLVRPLIDAATEVSDGEPMTAEFLANPTPSLLAWLTKGTLALGVLLFLLRDKLLALGTFGARLARVGPARIHDGALALLFGTAKQVDRISADHVIHRGLILAFLAVIAIGVATFLSHGGVVLPESTIALGIHEIALMTLAVAGAIGAIVIRSRRASVAALGTVGFSIGLLFLQLGGPDLALTQVAVETLAVLLMLFIIPRVAHVDEPSHGGARALSMVVAVGVGLTFMLWVWAAAPSGEMRPVSAALANMSYPEAFGRNVVNVILVDFRAADTLGEIVVLTCAALGVVALVRTSQKAGAS